MSNNCCRRIVGLHLQTSWRPTREGGAGVALSTDGGGAVAALAFARGGADPATLGAVFPTQIILLSLAP